MSEAVMSGIERIPSTPISGTEATRRVSARKRGEDGRAFEEELDDQDAADNAEPKKPTARRDPHPPADEDSGNNLDLLA